MGAKCDPSERLESVTWFAEYFFSKFVIFQPFFPLLSVGAGLGRKEEAPFCLGNVWEQKDPSKRL